MKATFMLLALSVISMGATSQSLHHTSAVMDRVSADFKKFHKLYQKGQLEKLQKGLSKAKRKNGRAPELDYLMAVVYCDLAVETDQATAKKRLLTGALSSLKRARKKDVNNRFANADDALLKSVHNLFREQAQEELAAGKNAKAKYYVGHLANYFTDTLSSYATLFPSAKPVVVVKKEAPKPAVKTDYGTRFVVPGATVSRDALADYADNFVGTRYRWGGEAPGGFDCSGFVLYVYRNFGYDFNHSSREIAKIGKQVDKSQMKTGDLLFFGTRDANGRPKISHMAMLYSDEPGNLQVIHSTNKGVIIDGLNEKDYWTRKLLFANNIISP